MTDGLSLKISINSIRMEILYHLRDIGKKVYVNEGILIDENEVRIWAIVSLIQISASDYIIN